MPTDPRKSFGRGPGSPTSPWTFSNLRSQSVFSLLSPKPPGQTISIGQWRSSHHSQDNNLQRQTAVVDCQPSAITLAAPKFTLSLKLQSQPALSTRIGPISLDFVVTTGPLIPGRGVRACGRLELERCGNILQGLDRLERYQGSIRGPCHLTLHNSLLTMRQHDNLITSIDWEFEHDRHGFSRPKCIRADPNTLP